MRFALVLAAAALGTLLAPAAARAACTTTLSSPPDNSTQRQSPTFKWASTDCSQYRLQLSPSGTFAGDVTQFNWQTGKQKKMDEATWDSHQATDWAAGVYWRVLGKAADGSVTQSTTTRFVLMDPNLDDDAFSVGQGDCDDDDPSVFPGAAEVCHDAIDQDCDGGVDEGCVGPLSYGDLIITEILADPAMVADTAGEWFEVYNSTSSSIDLVGLVISDLGTDTHTVSSSALVHPGSTLVLGRSKNTAINGGAPVDLAYSGVTCGNNSDALLLTSPEGVLIDDVVYSIPGGWPTSAGVAMSLDPSLIDADANNDPVAWCPAVDPFGLGDLGTPGELNPVCE